MPSEKNDRAITCPSCEREWPLISEQGIVTDMVGRCYQCLVSAVTIARDEASEAADYVVDNCSYCGGVPGVREMCQHCEARGWELTDKDSVIEIVT